MLQRLSPAFALPGDTSPAENSPLLVQEKRTKTTSPSPGPSTSPDRPAGGLRTGLAGEPGPAGPGPPEHGAVSETPFVLHRGPGGWVEGPGTADRGAPGIPQGATGPRPLPAPRDLSTAAGGHKSGAEEGPPEVPAGGATAFGFVTGNQKPIKFNAEAARRMRAFFDDDDDGNGAGGPEAAAAPEQAPPKAFVPPVKRPLEGVDPAAGKD